MSDSGRYLGYDEDVSRWTATEDAERIDSMNKENEVIKAENARLEAENARLEAENAALRQQSEDALRHPIGNAKGPVFFCESCGNPYLGMYNHHTCTRRQA